MSDSNLRIARVKGWRSLGDDETGTYWITQGGQCRHCDWSGSIADAWELAEELKAAGHFVCIESCLESDNYDGWQVSVNFRDEIAPTAPEAIAAAWLAVMEER